jgi:hypothetical protein
MIVLKGVFITNIGNSYLLMANQFSFPLKGTNINASDNNIMPNR